MLSRSERHWQILVSEYKTCRKKLHSKREAHQIMLKMLSDTEYDKEQLQHKLYSLQHAAEELTLNSDYTPNLATFSVSKDGCKDSKSIVQGLILLVNKMQCDIDKKTQLLAHVTCENSDLKKDLKALRADKTGYNRVVSPVLESGDKGRENFLAMIQSLKQEVDVCNTRIKTLNDEATDFRIEREFYKQKLKSLTEQLMEKNECQPIADMETVLEENRHLREKVDKLQHINIALVTHNALPGKSRNQVSIHTRGGYPSSAIKKRSKRGKHVTFGEEGDEEEERYGFLKSMKEKVKVETELQHLQTLIADMQRVSNGLAETVLDKSTALKHQRASNRLLGARVTELEAKLRALEMSGFWNVPEEFTAAAPEEDSKREVLRRLTIRGVSEEEVVERDASVDLLLDPFEEDRVETCSASSSSPIPFSSSPTTWDNDQTCPPPDELTKLLDAPCCRHAEEVEGDLVDLLPVKEQGV